MMSKTFNRFFRYITFKQFTIFNLLTIILIFIIGVGISIGSFEFSVLKYFNNSLTTLEE